MDYLEAGVATVGHVAWPVTALALAYFARAELRSMVSSLAERIKDKGSDVSITREGVEIKAAVQAQEARIASMQVEQEQVRSLALGRLRADRPPPAARSAAPADRLPDELVQMANDYMAIDLPDYAQRVRAKDAAAQKMAVYVVTNAVDRELLARQKNEGLVLALASAILLSPESGDLDRLLRAGVGMTRLHVRYRVLVALTRLMEGGHVSEDQRQRAQELLVAYERGADAPLKRLVKNMRSLLRQTEAVSEA